MSSMFHCRQLLRDQRFRRASCLKLECTMPSPAPTIVAQPAEGRRIWWGFGVEGLVGMGFRLWDNRKKGIPVRIHVAVSAATTPRRPLQHQHLHFSRFGPEKSAGLLPRTHPGSPTRTLNMKAKL